MQTLLDKIPGEERPVPDDIESRITYVNKFIVPVVETLKNDNDSDVKYFATQSYDAIQKLVAK